MSSHRRSISIPSSAGSFHSNVHQQQHLQSPVKPQTFYELPSPIIPCAESTDLALFTVHPASVTAFYTAQPYLLQDLNSIREQLTQISVAEEQLAGNFAKETLYEQGDNADIDANALGRLETSMRQIELDSRKFVRYLAKIGHDMYVCDIELCSLCILLVMLCMRNCSMLVTKMTRITTNYNIDN